MLARWQQRCSAQAHPQGCLPGFAAREYTAPVGKRTLLSLYTGAGGLDLGFTTNGFENILCVEQDEEARELIRQNYQWPLCPTLDICDLDMRELRLSLGLRTGELDLLNAGPPCQPFSNAAKWYTGSTTGLRDPRAETIVKLCHCIKEFRPKCFVIENVPPAFSPRNRQHLMRYFNYQIGSEDYQIAFVTINSSDAGVPQSRRRTFCIGTKEQLESSTNADNWYREYHDKPMTAWDAIGRLEHTPDELAQLTVTGKWASLLPSIPEGRNYLYHTPRGEGKPIFGYRRRYWSFLLKLAREKPSWTISASPGSSTGPFHWNNRQLSTKELLSIQSLPVNLKLCSNARTNRRLIGNAVPPGLSEYLCHTLICKVFDIEPEQRRYRTKRYRSTPTPVQVKRVPKKYMSLNLNISDHPGHGKGPLYQIRSDK